MDERSMAILRHKCHLSFVIQIALNSEFLLKYRYSISIKKLTVMRKLKSSTDWHGMLLFCSAYRICTAHISRKWCADPRHGYYAFTNATIVKDAATT